MKMNTELATLAEAEEDIDDEDDEDSDDNDEEEQEEGEHGNHDVNTSGSEISTFDVPHFRYIDDEDLEQNKEERDHTWRSFSTEEDCCTSSSYRYVVVSGTPLKILEHLLSDLRLDDQRGAPESRESGKLKKHAHAGIRHNRSETKVTIAFHIHEAATLLISVV